METNRGFGRCHDTEPEEWKAREHEVDATADVILCGLERQSRGR